MVKYANAHHEFLCNDQTLPPKVWMGLALQLLLRTNRIDEHRFKAELDKLDLQRNVERNIIHGRHCMLSPLCDMATMIAAEQIQVVGSFSEEGLFWALASQIAVHKKQVLQDLARYRNAERKMRFPFCAQRMAEEFARVMEQYEMKTPMNTTLAQPVMHLLGKLHAPGKRTHISLVSALMKEFDFEACATKLKGNIDHSERMRTLQSYLGNVELRCIQILRLLEATACPEWQGAWESEYTGAGARPVIPGMNNQEFHALVLHGVEELAPTWLLRMLDEYPLRLDTLQASQHIRCETRKIARPKLPTYEAPVPDLYHSQFFRSIYYLGRNLNNSHSLHQRRFHVCENLKRIQCHKRQYWETFAVDGGDEEIYWKYRQTIVKKRKLHKNLARIGSWLLFFQDYHAEQHHRITDLLTQGLQEIAHGYEDWEAEAEPKHRGCLLLVMQALLERSDEWSYECHQRLWRTLLESA